MMMPYSMKVKVSEINPAYKQTILDIGRNQLGYKAPTVDRVIKALYKSIIKKPAVSEYRGYRTAEHPAITTNTPTGEAKIRLKGGIYFVGTLPYLEPLERTKKVIKEEIKPLKSGKIPLKYPTGPTGFYLKPYASYYYRVGKEISEKCPNAIINIPIAMIEFPRLKVEEPGGRKSVCAAVIETKKPTSYRVTELREKVNDEAWLYMVNTLIAGSENSYERKKWSDYKASQKARIFEANSEERQSIMRREAAKLFYDFKEKLVKNFERNLITIYNETGYLPQVGGGMADNTDTLGRLTDYDLFQKVPHADAKANVEGLVDELNAELKALRNRLFL